ncbi:MAG TPA: 4-hydroxythreonine-4-phosphate dehydrogenase PdxA [Thermodesulfobacteriota bacterium]|nr:4-hydroxythreonine-4-phosphate dehydrogenase PdxA [Thermodesulfobacteriota bacterium]
MNTNQDQRPKVAVIMGDATGIGPEIVAKSLSVEEIRRLCRPAVVGDARVMTGAIKLTEAPLKIVIRNNWKDVTGERGLMEMFDLANLDPKEYKVGEVSPRAGKACLEYVEWTIPQVMAGQAQAMVFAPMNKQAMRLGGSPYKGELDHFAHLTKADLFGEINVLDPLWTSRVTSHIGFREICGQLSVDRIFRAITLLHRTMVRGGIENPRIGVAALNPHAGEEGLFGPEEEDIIKPAVEKARQEGMDIKGPFPADTIFVRARKGELLGIVTMYHDQGQIATKLLGFDRGVTVSGGLPIAIATPAHGTAHDIAGKGIADIGAFQAALRVAVRMVRPSKK